MEAGVVVVAAGEGRRFGGPKAFVDLEGASLLERAASPFASFRDRVAVLGDSSVTAPGVSGPEEIWVTRVGARLGETHHVTLRSFAFSGSKAADLIDNQLEPALAFVPDLFLVAVGANDALRGVRLRSFEVRLDDLVSIMVESG